MFKCHRIRALKFTWFQGDIEQISETEIHCLLLKTKYSWDRNSLINCQKVGKSFEEAPRRCFVNFHSTPENNIQPLLEAWWWLRQIFGPTQNSPACILWSWKRGQGGKGEPGILEKCSLYIFWKLACWSGYQFTKWKFSCASPRQSKRVSTLKSQISSIFSPRGINIATRSFWINQKSRLQQETFAVPYCVLGRRLDFKKNPYHARTAGWLSQSIAVNTLRSN